MARHVMTAHSFWVRRLRNDEELELANVDNTGRDMVDVLYEALRRKVAGDATVVPGRVSRIRGVNRRGRVLRVASDQGHHGAGGDLLNVTDGRHMGLYDDNTAPMVPLRTLLVVPIHGTRGLVLAEVHAARSTYTVVRDTLQDHVRQTLPGYRLEFEAVTYSQALSSATKLMRVTLRTYRQVDIADSPDPRQGELRVELRPPRRRYLPLDLLADMVAGTRPPHEVVGLQEPLPGARTEVTVKLPGENRKATFDLETDIEARLAVRERIADDEAERPDDEAFYDFAEARAVDWLLGLGVELPPGWSLPGPGEQ